MATKEGGAQATEDEVRSFASAKFTDDMLHLPRRDGQVGPLDTHAKP